MESTGKCNKLFARNVTRDSCCHAGAGLGFSERDITDVQIFFVNAFNDAMDCGSCIGKCRPFKAGLCSSVASSCSSSTQIAVTGPSAVPTSAAS